MGAAIMNQDATHITDMPGRVRSILEGRSSQQENLLPVLHEIQDALGFIPTDSVADIAGRFNLSHAEVHGIITFYHHFRTAPPARHAVQVCRAEACQSMGAEQLLAHAESTLGCCLHAKSADGNYSLEPVYCLGQCATAPAIMINDEVHARVTPGRFDRLLARAKGTV
jgi:formate dehydrogenase subunit gamma